MHRKAGGQGGFSLLELMVVIVIMGLLAVIALPSFSGRLGGIEREANRIAAALRFASEAAAARKHTRAIKFDISAGTMSYDQDGEMEVRKLDTLRSVELPSKGEVTEGELIVFFSPQGYTEHLDVHLRKDGQDLTIQFNPISRKVKIFEPPKDKKDKDDEKNGKEQG